MTSPNPTHLYLSCAVEDTPLATWLARKLTAQGYPVWFDKLKSLGGEPWPPAVDETIKERTFRMLALVSEHSLQKKKPVKEQMLAQRVVRQRNVPDFVIPLTLDGSELDPLNATAPAISFENDWGSGLRTLLKRLEAIHAPRSLKDGAGIAAASFSQGANLINRSGGQLLANIVRVKSFPNTLRVFQSANYLDTEEREALEEAWTFYEITKDAIIATIPPPPEFSDRIKPTRELLHWAEHGMFQNMRLRDIAAAVILKALTRRLAKASCMAHPSPAFRETYFLPETFSENGNLEFRGFEGKKIAMPIRSKITFRRTGGEIESDFNHFAFRLRMARGLDEAFYIQLIPTLVFFDERGKALPDKNAITRLRRVTQTWKNEEWLNRVLAAEHVLGNSSPVSPNDPVLEPGLVTLNSPKDLDETVVDESKEKIGEPIQELELDEPEAEEVEDE
jgi:hypothetical protein